MEIDKYEESLNWYKRRMAVLNEYWGADIIDDVSWLALAQYEKDSHKLRIREMQDKEGK